MKPSLEELAAVCPAIDEGILREHLDRLDASYYETFSIEQVADHLNVLGSLSTQHPCDAVVTRLSDGHVACTVIAYNDPSVFSLITGVLAGSQFSVLSGDVFTYARVHAKPVARRDLERRHRLKAGAAAPRRIIDHFIGTLQAPGSEEELKSELVRTLNSLHGADEDHAETTRNHVHEWVAAGMVRANEAPDPVLLPIKLDIDNEGPTTLLRVRSQDTPAFLYSLSIVLAANRISIEKIRIRTHDGRIEDDIYVLDAGGNKIQEPEDLDPLTFAVLLTKQFSYQLSRAPDPSAALRRYELMIGDLLQLPERGQWVELLSQPEMLRDLARILGASEFIWEDFLRVQYESLLPILMPHVRGERLRKTRDQLHRELTDRVKRAPTLDAKRDTINEFKDDEAYTIDLSHIVDNAHDPRAFAEALTELSELVINAVVSVELNELVRKHGNPRTVGNLDTRFAVFGLGKLGGVALGYASDIELLFVYSDSGHTDGTQPIQNSDFFEQLVQNVTNAIRSKREGIFRIDLRLRPHGSKGPLACSLDNFVRYYGPGGRVHSFERLALVRLRAIGGDPEFGARIERLRDEFVYRADSIDLGELRDLRLKQFEEKIRRGTFNAKFSPGALVDLEYDVQILQVMHGAENPALRTPRIHRALAALAEQRLLEREECDQLTNAYYFLRHLINGLRMLRGSAQDLLLPAEGSLEFAHLARRMGYERGTALRPEEQLHLDFETHTAVVRQFVEDHFGRESLPGPPRGSVADVIFSRHPDSFAHELFTRAGFKDPVRCVKNIETLARVVGDRHRFAPLAVLALDIISRTPDPDMALNNWERYTLAVDRPTEHSHHLLTQPRRLEILLDIFAASQFLADTLIRFPEFFEWVTDPDLLHADRSRERMEQELVDLSRNIATHDDWLAALRRFRRREILRIGTRDICLKVAIPRITDELSALADAVIVAALARIGDAATGPVSPSAAPCPATGFCVLALGKLGGSELNYSSDVDLLAVCDSRFQARDYEPIMEQLRTDIATHTPDGIAYRVDLRLRPYGGAGQLVHRTARLIEYYRHEARLWEIQALLKIRFIAGDADLAATFIAGIRPLLDAPRAQQEITDSIREMRDKAVRKTLGSLAGRRDIKSGLGGIRDAEFLVQGLQLENLANDANLFDGNTLRAADKLVAAGLLPKQATETLKSDYVFLRRVEHCMQILEDRQVHALPRNEQALEALAKRVLGSQASAGELLAELGACQARVRHLYGTYLGLPGD